jgi:hypothetical protein
MPAGVPDHARTDLAGPPPAGYSTQEWHRLVWAGAVAIAEGAEQPNEATPEEYAAWAIRAALTADARTWKRVAGILAQQMESHAHCDRHPAAASVSECPFCADRTAYAAWVTKTKRA